jgi:hypothetical protein
MAAPQRRKFAPESSIPFWNESTAMGLPKVKACILKGVQEGLIDPRTLDAWFFGVRSDAARLTFGKSSAKASNREKEEGHAEKMRISQPVPLSVLGFQKFVGYKGGIAGLDIGSVKRFADVKKTVDSNLATFEQWTAGELEEIMGEDQKIDSSRISSRLHVAGLTDEEIKKCTGWYPYFGKMKPRGKDLPSERPSTEEAGVAEPKVQKPKEVEAERPKAPAPKVTPEKTQVAKGPVREPTPPKTGISKRVDHEFDKLVSMVPFEKSGIKKATKVAILNQLKRFMPNETEAKAFDDWATSQGCISTFEAKDMTLLHTLYTSLEARKFEKVLDEARDRVFSFLNKYKCEEIIDFPTAILCGIIAMTEMYVRTIDRGDEFAPEVRTQYYSTIPKYKDLQEVIGDLYATP